jgi:hypothetical protein
MTATDPLVIVRDALDARDCRPSGALHQYTALCPAHEDRTASLSIGTGGDGRALVYCHRGCTDREIVAALGLTMADLFPAEHRNGRRIPGVAKPVPMADLVLSALKRLDIDYRRTLAPDPMWAASHCPICQRADKWPLWLGEDHRRRFYVTCAGGCDQIAILDALAVIR